MKTWFQDARTCDILISGPVLEEKAKDLALALQNTDFVPRHDWLARWKARNQIAYKRQHGEKKDADHVSADHWTTNVLPKLLHTYDPDDIYNADKTGIYYRALPDGTLTEKPTEISSSKKLKNRITALVSCNMTGTDKCRLQIIGKSKDPHCFRGVKNLPVIYKNNKNSWLNGEIFTHWLKDLNKDMRRQRRNVLLLVDNCSAHTPSSADSLTNVRLKFLPPNTTSIIQPCDQGIIRNLKSYYRTQIVRRLISDIDSPETTATDYAKKLTLLDAVHLLSTAW